MQTQPHAPPDEPGDSLAERYRLDGLARVAGKVAHDFNNLVTGILGHVSLARLTPDHVAQALDGVEMLALRAAGLCRQLGSLTGLPASGTTALNLADCLERAVAARQSRCPGGIAVRLEPTPDIRQVQADPSQVAEALDRLIDNSEAALGDAPGEVVLRMLPEEPAGPLLSYSTGGSLAWVEVRDTGPGLSPEAKARLFEPFFTTRPGKPGLGLPSVLAIMRSHGGAVQATSEPGSGTAVRLGFPLAAAAVHSTETQGARRLATILLADDEEAVRDVVCRLLHSLGYKVLTAHDGEKAVALHAEQPEEIRLALIDLTMPNMCGDEATRRLRAASASLPIILMSGYAEADIKPRFATVPGVSYLQKPFRLPALVEILRKTLPG